MAGCARTLGGAVTVVSGCSNLHLLDVVLRQRTAVAARLETLRGMDRDRFITAFHKTDIEIVYIILLLSKGSFGGRSATLSSGQAAASAGDAEKEGGNCEG